MSPSDRRRCPRCSRTITKESAFAIHVWPEGGKLLYDVVYAKNTPEHGILMHMSGDRECGPEVSAYIGKLLRIFELPNTCDTSFLERL